MTNLFATLPLEQAAARIAKLGYSAICPGARHPGGSNYTPELAKADRPALLRRLRDAGVEPVMSLGGFSGELNNSAALDKYRAQLDLCADFEIPVMVGGGPWYFKKFPTVPKRERDWQVEVANFYRLMEQAVRHAESVKVTIALKPHTGITARAKDCIQVMQRIQSPCFKIAWDAGNISYYEGIYPDPDLADLAPHVVAVCIKEHAGGRAEHNFPVPGQGNIDHAEMFRTLFGAGFRGPLCIELIDLRGDKVPPEVMDQRLTQAREHLAPLLERTAPKA
jgi:sugar phosphate isomerase/epimerase